MTCLSLLLAAAWITGDYRVPAEDDYAAFFADAPAPSVSCRFELPEKPVRRAVWRVVAPGMYDAFVNGCRVTATALPVFTDFRYRLLEDEIDVTDRIRAGANALRFELGNGWWNLLPVRMWGTLNIREHLLQGVPMVRATLAVEFADGTRREVATDGSWRAGATRVVRNNLYLGEKYDARLQTDARGPATVVEGPPGAVEPRGAVPPVVVYRTWRAKAVASPRPGIWVVDFGENFAGNARMRFRGLASGAEVRALYGETLFPDGRVNGLTTVCGQIKYGVTDPPGVAYQRDAYLADGAAEAVYEPRFTFHAFRYMELEGLAAAPRPEDFTALAYSSDVRDAADFTCSNPRLNAVRDMCRRTFRANLQGVQSDCPGRERFGYGADLAVTAESFILNYDMAAFYRKVLRDRMDSTRGTGGLITYLSPRINAVRDMKGTPLGWTVDLPIVADLLLRYYGDRASVREVYPVLVRFLDLCEKAFPPDRVQPCVFGDHEALEAPEKTMTAACHYHQFLKLTARFARLLGKPADAARFEKTAAAIETAFRSADAYVVLPGYVGHGRQADEAFALYHGMFAPENAAAAYRLLRKDVIGHGCALSTGIFSTQYLLELLTAHGDAELAGRVVTHEGFPGYFHMLDRGATTLWETWAETDDTYSMNHPMFGSVAAWLMRGILGIEVCEDAVGCDRVRIRPRAVAGLTFASGHYDTPHGRISVSWRLENGKMVVEKSVPPGVTVVAD